MSPSTRLFCQLFLIRLGRMEFVMYGCVTDEGWYDGVRYGQENCWWMIVVVF